MDETKTNHFRKLLESMLRDTDHTIDLMKDNNTAEMSNYSPSELSNYDNHPAELGTEMFLVELNSALRVHEENIIQDIEDALDKIDKGTYGKCEHCGDEIPEERLEALPYAKLCIKCKDEIEDSPEHVLYRGKGRANEELILDAPFGRKYLNKREDDEYEGLDQFNDLEKYGSSDTPQDMGGYHDYDDFYTNEVDRQGIVDDMDRISNEEYKKQLPD